MSVWVRLSFALVATMLVNCGGSNTPPPAAVIDPATPAPPGSTATQNGVPVYDHVFIVIDENHSYAEVIGNASMPYLNSLAARGGSSTNYFANATQSLPDYFMLTVGDTVTTGASYSGTVTGDNIVRELVAAGKTWKAYMESLPSVGYLDDGPDPYKKIHNPFAYLSDVVNSDAQRMNIVPLTQLAADIASGDLPNYAMIVPNNQNNGHDCPAVIPSCTNDQNLANVDAWIKSNIGPLLDAPKVKQNGLVILTWDEGKSGDSTNGGGQVPFIAVGPRVRAGAQSSMFAQHEHGLRTMCDALGLKTCSGKGAQVDPIRDLFQ